MADLTVVETAEALPRAVDNNSRRLIEHARSEWERRFLDKDPSDACVSVRIIPAEVAAERKPVRGSGFVKLTKKLEQRSNISLPRYAQ